MIETTTSEALFTDESQVRQIHREGVLLLGAGRALLMQVAHPLVARGVVEHSTYRGDRFGRLLRTLRPMFAITYGSEAEGRTAAGRVNSIHSGVTGEGYNARDPELLLWVLATLIDTTLVMQRRFVGDLPREAAEAYYQDVLTIGETLGLPRHLAPADLTAFDAYMDEMTASLKVSEQALDIARELFRLPVLLSPAAWPLRWLTAGLLPPSLRRQYGLHWGALDERALNVAGAASRRGLRFVPFALRRTPSFLLPHGR